MVETSTFTSDPEILTRIATLKIHATRLVEGLLSGQHKSPHKGSSVEFAEYKDYTPGDDIRHIDWKVVGKTDKYHVKQFEQSTNLKCNILLDASGSMAYKSPLKNSSAMDKADYARTLVAALSYLLLKQYDAVGLISFNKGVTDHIPPRSKPSHFQPILYSVGQTQFSGETRIKQTVEELIEGLPRRGMLIMVSDLLSRDDDVLKTLKLISSKGLEVILFHILHPDEVLFPFDGDIVFESLEDDPPIGLDPVEIRQQYQELIQDIIRHYRHHCPSLGIDYQFTQTDTPLDQVLRYYLLKRRSLFKA